MSKPYNQWNVPTPTQESPAPSLYGASNVSKPYNQWEAPAPAPAPTGQTYNQYQQNVHVPSTGQQPQWQQGGYQAQDSQSSHAEQQYVPTPEQDIQAPRPLARTDTTSSDLYAQPSPQSQPVSPVSNRQSMSFSSGHQTGLGRTGSVSSIALANLHAQRESNRTSSPRPAPPKLPTPPPPRDTPERFSALGTGGPSDWEHFGADAEIDDEEIFARKDRPAQLDSVELPARQPEVPVDPSPLSAHDWPSPATQPATSMSGEMKDDYQPTPPPVIASLAERSAAKPQQQNSVIGDIAPVPPSISPKPNQGARPSSTQPTFALSEGAWQPPNEIMPAHQKSQHNVPPAQQGFVMDNGGWVAQLASTQSRQQTPIQQPQQFPPVTTGFVVGDGSFQRTPTQETSVWGPQQTEKHAAELRAKDEVIERLQLDSEQENAVLQAETVKLKTELESSSTHAVNEKVVLQEQINAMKTVADQAKTNAEAVAKDLLVTIERLKEDVEGKEHNIEERESMIADLRRKLEVEKSKDPVKISPVPADLIPDIDPWYVGSLERYITMLRDEANEPQVEDKIKIFRAFLKAESTVRGLEFYDAPPAVSKENAVTQHMEGLLKASNMSKPAVTREDLSVQVPGPPQDSPDEDCHYSPGGRPLLERRATIPLNENVPVQHPAGSSAQSITILTPTSSVNDDSNKTPVQSPPEEQPQPVYKAYVPPALFSNPSPPSVHRQSVSDAFVPAPLVSHTAKSFEQRPILPTSTSKHHDEIFFGAQKQDTSKDASRPASSDNVTPDVSLPAPLAFASHRSVPTAPPSTKDPTESLSELLPAQIAPTTSHHMIEEIRAKLTHPKNNTSSIDDLTKQWDTIATVTRKKYDSARRKRQEDNEEANDDAFNNEEISYADLNVLEEEFKQKENDLKAQEDRDEYASYVEAVFDPTFNTLQSEIKALVDLHIEAENLLHTSTTGAQSLEPEALSTLSSLDLLQDVHNAILDRQDRVVNAVAERDKRYKKTEIQPLYASGNITKMKTVEKHFENAEKQAIIRALRDKATRVGELVSVVENVVVNAVSVEQREIDHIIAALRDLDDGAADAALVARAHSTLIHLKSSSKSLLSLFNDLEIRHNAAVLDAEIAQARLEGKDVKHLEEEKEKGEKGFMDEFHRRVEVIEQDEKEIEELVKAKSAVGGEELEKERRLKAALEEAKRRNGHV
jgi:hypothetical protein